MSLAHVDKKGRGVAYKVSGPEGALCGEKETNDCLSWVLMRRRAPERRQSSVPGRCSLPLAQLAASVLGAGAIWGRLVCFCACKQDESERMSGSSSHFWPNSSLACLVWSGVWAPVPSAPLPLKMITLLLSVTADLANDRVNTDLGLTLT